MPCKDKNDRREYQALYNREHHSQIRAQAKLHGQQPEIKAKRKAYATEYAKNHRDSKNANMREWRKNHPHSGLNMARDWRRRLRLRVIEHFGGNCVKCGCSDWRALQIDHINGGGRKARENDRPSPVRYHLDLLNAEPGLHYQLLCANCNQIKKYEREEFSRRQSI